MGGRTRARLSEGHRASRPGRGALQQQGLWVRVGLRLAQQAVPTRRQHPLRGEHRRLHDDLVAADRRDMRRSWCVLLAAVMTAAACSAPPVRAALPPARPGLPPSVRVYVAQEKKVRRVTLEDYVRAAIISEYAPPDGDPRLVQQMLEVQAVIARTYAVANLRRHAGQGYDLCSSTHCQLYEPSRLKTSRWAGLAAAAVKRTAGQLLWYRGTAVNTLFHADCGGHTSTSSAAWGGTSQPYLVAASDDGPAKSAHAEWGYRIPLSDL